MVVDRDHYFSLAPSPILSDLVKKMWYYRSEEEHLRLREDRYLPNGYCELIFDLGDSYSQRNSNEEWIPAPRHFFSGLYTEHFFVKSGKTTRRIGVVFEPGALTHFINHPVRELHATIYNLEDLIPAAKTFLDKVGGESDVPYQLLKWLDQFLVKLYVQNQFHQDVIVQEAVKIIQRSEGNVKIDRLANRLHISERHFRRRFTEYVGISPKKLCKVFRIHEIYRKHRGLSEISLHSISHQYGFYDTSHLIKEFKSVSGLHPQQYFAEDHQLIEALYPE